MTNNPINDFFEALKADPSLQEQLKTAADVDAVVEVAKAAGYTITSDQVISAIKGRSIKDSSQLSDSDLEMVAGGKNKDDRPTRQSPNCQGCYTGPKGC